MRNEENARLIAIALGLDAPHRRRPPTKETRPPDKAAPNHAAEILHTSTTADRDASPERALLLALRRFCRPEDLAGRRRNPDLDGERPARADATADATAEWPREAQPNACERAAAPWRFSSWLIERGACPRALAREALSLSIEAALDDVEHATGLDPLSLLDRQDLLDAGLSLARVGEASPAANGLMRRILETDTLRAEDKRVIAHEAAEHAAWGVLETLGEDARPHMESALRASPEKVAKMLQTGSCGQLSHMLANGLGNRDRRRAILEIAAFKGMTIAVELMLLSGADARDVDPEILAACDEPVVNMIEEACSSHARAGLLRGRAKVAELVAQRNYAQNYL